ncbi:MAG: alpha/beta hydrolase [Chitinophagaceae bacterium]|nr:alpha/beta hydrolase [Chitinophagaceae bacterium]
MIEKQIPQDGLSIHYTVSGSREPVLFVHGFGEDGNVWNAVTENLKNEFTVIVPDLPGSGNSTGTTENTTIESLAESIRLILEKEKISSCPIIGHSMGGYVTLAFAAKYPEKVSKLGLFHSTAFADSSEKKIGRQKNIDFIMRNGARKFLEQSIPKLFSPETNTKNPALIRETIQKYSNFSQQSLVHYTAAMMNRPERTDILRNFAGPVLFIMGEYDTAIPLDQSLKECHLPGISYIYICTHSGHSGMLEEPEFCVGAVRYFLSGR